jgi:hypothetical protein
MKSFIKKQVYNPLKAFDDSSLLLKGPNISKERSFEIEQLMLPLIENEIEKLKKYKNELYSN